MNEWVRDFDVHHRPYPLKDLMPVLEQLAEDHPDCYVGRSAHGIGNLCIYTAEGEYIGVIDLGQPDWPEVDWPVVK